MNQYEITFCVYKVHEPGRASIGSSLTSNLKTIVSATSETAARSLIQAQYGKLCSIYGVRRVG